MAIIRDNDIRKSLDTFTSPLDKIGYNKIEVSNEEQDRYQVVTSQRQAFRYIPPDIIEEEVYQDTVSIVYLSPELSKWSFEGKNTFWADVLDEEFLNKTKGQRFSELKGKKFFVTGIKRIVRKGGKIKGKPTYTIDQAIEVPKSLPLL